MPITVVASLALSLAGSRSPAVAAVARLVTPGTAAAATDMVSVQVRLSPAAMGPGLVAVTAEPEAANDQPAPAPLTKLSPVGRLSVTAMAPEVAPLPRLWTTSV